MNIGIEKTTFRRMRADAGEPDCRALDRWMAHPEYAAQSRVWAYRLAERRYQRKQ